MAVSANGSRICDTNRVALAGIDVDFTLTDNNAFIIFAGGVDTAPTERIDKDHKWQFRRVGGTFADITATSEVKLANTAALVDETAVADADRRCNSGGTFIVAGKEFEILNPQGLQQRVQDGEVTESQVGLDFSGAPGNQQYEFQCLWDDPGQPVIYAAKITTADVAAPATDTVDLDKRILAGAGRGIGRGF